MLPALALLPFVAQGDTPPQVVLATPGTGASSGVVDRFTLRFSEAMVPLGDPRAKAAATSTCPGAGPGRWADQQTFVIEFDKALPGGTTCEVKLRPGLATLRGGRIQGKTSFTIDTGGPAVVTVLAPGYGDDEIDEDQVFLVATNVPANPASVAAKASCAVDGIGEAAAVDVLPSTVVDQILDGLGKDDYRRTSFLTDAQVGDDLPSDGAARRNALRNVLALKCRRPLPPKHDMSLVWPGTIVGVTGKPAGRDQRFDYTVREAFSAQFECGRVNGRAACNPITDAHVRFTAPVDRAVALAVRLKFADGTERKPTLDDDDKNKAQVADLNFGGGFPADSTAQVVLPSGIRDLSGRPLANATRFPLPVRFAPAPPLVKFAAAFGIIEASEGASLPVTVRAVEPSLAGKAVSIIGQSQRVADDDAQIAAWVRRLDKAENREYTTIEHKDGTSTAINHTRDKPLLMPGGRAMQLGLPGKGKDFEVVGIPLASKGFHVVELASPALGAALLGRPVPRYVATGALVTDMAVHFKWGRESSLVWVTSLDDAAPVAGADVRISNSCNGKLIASGKTDASGLLKVNGILPEPNLGGGCGEDDEPPLMVSARANGDMSFTLSNWNEGISPYDFEMSFGSNEDSDIVHTVFDRELVRVGETVHFKQVMRHPVGSGFAYPKGLTGKLVFKHEGTDTEFSQPVTINAAGTSEGEWAVPQGAPLGDYDLTIEVGDKTIYTGQSVRVDEYKLPNMRATITGPKEALVQPGSVPLSLFVGYLSGGGAGGLPVTLRTDYNSYAPDPKGWDGFTFGGEPLTEGTRPLDSYQQLPEPTLPFAETLPATLGADGTAKLDLPVGQAITQPVSLSLEMDYADANGETMTAGRRLTLYPAALQVGLKTDGWMMRGDDLRLQTVVVGLDGQPLSGRTVQIELYSRDILTARRRLIGGFYAYDNQERVTKLSGGCLARTDKSGRASCKLAPGISGEVTMVARAKDDQGRESRAVQSVWLAGKDDWWFGGDNGDRMDLIPEKTEYKAGDTARFQVRMPFRAAQALVTVEREGVLSSFVTELSGADPVVEVKLPGSYAPNVYVSVMAVRGRVKGGSLWLSDMARNLNLPFFSQDAASPTATVDLGKPSYRIGMSQIKVGWEGHQLGVTVKPERPKYAVRETANVTLSVKQPDGKPATSADVAFVAVDEALLTLMPNKSWDLLGAMMGERNLEVATSTAQMQVVGKRHYGKKAVAAGGGGGGDASAVNRENFKPVLLWQGHVTLDGNGEAKVPVPLSDSLSSFKLVAVATDGSQMFGTGETEIRTAQDLSLYSGLPAIVRTGDHYDAVFTVRNASDKKMKIVAEPQLEPALAKVKPLSLELPAGGAGQLRWSLDAPPAPGVLKWTVKARSSDGKASDGLTATQEIIPAVPVEVWAATLLRVGDPAPTIATPQGALPGGYVTVDFSETLAAPLGGVRDYMIAYPFDCFEQRLSKIVVANDSAAWTTLAAAFPTYLDSDGLVRYWPDAQMQGSSELTAYVLAMTSAAGLPLPDAPKAKMIAALQGVVEGRIERSRHFEADERLVRIAALSALARAGAAKPGLVAKIDMVPADMPTSALADWIVALDRLPGAPRAAMLKAAAEGELRKRLVYEGTRFDLSDANNTPWWMMTSRDEMALKALDAVMNKSAWSSDVPRMMVGAGARQVRGHWDTTPANAWGAVISRRFAAKYPATAIAGTTHVALGSGIFDLTWPRAAQSAPVQLPLIDGPLTLTQSGGAGPWATVAVHAAVPLTQPLNAGYRLTREMTVVQAKQQGKLSQGDVVRVRLTIEASAERTWVALSDPLPPGAVVMSALGGQSQQLQAGEKSEGAWPAYSQSSRGTWQAFFDWLPRGITVIEYTLRLNTAGNFALPPARVEAMYAPEIRGAFPIAPVTVWGS
jgi:alpha-2-macroglobulin